MQGGRYVIGMELVLKDNGKPKEYNLLCPDNICMGLQAFDFNGVDFVHGPEKSIYGATRTMPVPGRAFVVNVKVLDAAISPIAGSKLFQLDKLDLDLSADKMVSGR